MREILSPAEAGVGDWMRVEQVGRFVSVGVRPARLEGPAKAGRRGEVSSYSHDSKKRFGLRLGALGDAWDQAVMWVTLTFSTRAAPDAEQAGKCLVSWWNQVRADNPEAFCLWKREFTKAGTIHFHAFLFGCGGEQSDLWAVRRLSRAAWCEAAKYNGCFVEEMKTSSTDIQWWRGGSDKCVYALKEAGKGIGVVEYKGGSIGRSWGIRGRRHYDCAVDVFGGVHRELTGHVTSTYRVIGEVGEDVVRQALSAGDRVLRSSWAIVGAGAAGMLADVIEQMTTLS